MSKKLEYWTNKYGTKIPIDEMSESHKDYSFRMTMRAINYSKLKAEKVRKANKAFEVHGEMASEDAVDFEIFREFGIDPKEENEDYYYK